MSSDCHPAAVAATTSQDSLQLGLCVCSAAPSCLCCSNNPLVFRHTSSASSMSHCLNWAAIRLLTVTCKLLCNVTTTEDLLLAAGFSDPVYAEAYVTVHQYDIVLDVTVINRTTETLQNLCLELATMGDLKLVERPQNYTLGPGAQKSIR